MTSETKEMSSNAGVSPEQDDEVVVLYEKIQDHKRNCSSGALPFENRVEQCSVRLEDIPLPPDSWLPDKKIAYNYVGRDGCRSNNAQDISHNFSSEIESNLKLSDEVQVNSRLSANSFQLYDIKNDVMLMKREVGGFREWHWIDNVWSRGETAQSEKGNPAIFTVMSYNVLAQDLLETHQYLYQKHDTRALSWDHRKAVLFEEIGEANPDILCLQEVQHNHLHMFKSHLRNLGYTLGLYKQRTNGKVDGCALFFKKRKFKLIESTSVEFYQYYQSGLSILDRDNVAIIARLQLQGMKDNDHQIVVATTHLLYNPRRHDIKLAQTQMLLAEVERIAFIDFDSVTKVSKYWPVILTGDFNLEPGSAVYRFLTEGFLRYSDLAERTLSIPVYGQPHQEALLPQVLRISSTSQHLGLLHGRKKLRHTSESHDSQEMRLLKIYNSDHYKSFRHFSQKVSLASESTDRWDTGSISHTFNLKSVYSHQRLASNGRGIAHEATTHQKGWVTVDYILYSDISKDKPMLTRGSLKLLSRYSLPTRDQCHRLRQLPNLVCGSDHLPLMAKFLLTSDTD